MRPNKRRGKAKAAAAVTVESASTSRARAAVTVESGFVIYRGVHSHIDNERSRWFLPTFFLKADLENVLPFESSLVKPQTNCACLEGTGTPPGSSRSGIGNTTDRNRTQNNGPVKGGGGGGGGGGEGGGQGGGGGGGGRGRESLSS